LKPVFGSAFARLATLFGLLLAMAASIVFFLVYLAFSTSSEATLRQLVDTDLSGLVELYTVEGPTGLAERIEDRLKLRPARAAEAVYLLTDEDGKPLAGNLQAWPEGATLDAEWFMFTTPSTEGDPVEVVSRATLLRGNYRILVGRSTAVRSEAMAQLRRVFAIGAGLTLALGALGGVIASRLFLRRVDALNQTCAAVRQGQITARAPGGERRDELGLLSREINAMLDRIERLLTAQRDVTDRTAHELRTPLTRLTARLDQIAVNATRSDTISAIPDAIAGARSDMTNLVRLFDSLLEISSAETARGDARGLERVDLTAITEDMVGLYEAVAEDREVRLDVSLAPHVTLQGNPLQMSRIVANLIDNAVKYTPSGSRVKITLADGPVLVVEDQGPGVPEPERERIFERFTRASTAGETHGHGLGLSLVKALAERHGLVVRVEDANPGARFIVGPAEPLETARHA
jgi:signal transduction histidine kinase